MGEVFIERHFTAPLRALGTSTLSTRPLRVSST